MPVFDIFSKRQKRLRGETSDVYSHTELPSTFRVQICHIIDGVVHDVRYINPQASRDIFPEAVKILCREHGVFQLVANSLPGTEPREELYHFLLNTDRDKVLDVVEASFHVMRECHCSTHVMDAAVSELNTRFREHGIGYYFGNGRIIRIDSKHIHTEVVKPALQLLGDKQFSGAQDEFLKAHQHYRKGNGKEALNECLKAFESTMKTVCDMHRWKYKENVTAKMLIKICMDNKLIPLYWQQHFSALRSTLESGVPTLRNKLGAHGQGTDVKSVPDYVIRYALHMTAAAIVFLAEAGTSSRPSRWRKLTAPLRGRIF